jgi:hypothetical protein
MHNNTGALLVVSEDYYFLLIDIIVQIMSLVRLSYNVHIVPAFSKVVIWKLTQPNGTETKLIVLFASIGLKPRILSGGGLLSGMIRYGRRLQR